MLFLALTQFFLSERLVALFCKVDGYVLLKAFYELQSIAGTDAIQDLLDTEPSFEVG
jgi:hypothetical protein